MKRILLTTTTVLGLATVPAFAGNLSEPIMAPSPAPMPAPAPVNYSGDWGGFYAGGSLGYADASDEAATFGPDFNGLTYGVHAGYDYDFGSLVIGGEFELSGFDVNDAATNTDIDSVTRLKVRAGYDAGAFLPYLTAGVAQLNTSGGLGDLDDTGTFYGVGMDYKLTDSIRVGGEVLQHDFDEYAGSALNVDAVTAGVRVAFEF